MDARTNNGSFEVPEPTQNQYWNEVYTPDGWQVVNSRWPFSYLKIACEGKVCVLLEKNSQIFQRISKIIKNNYAYHVKFSYNWGDAECVISAQSDGDDHSTFITNHIAIWTNGWQTVSFKIIPDVLRNFAQNDLIITFKTAGTSPSTLLDQIIIKEEL